MGIKGTASEAIAAGFKKVSPPAQKDRVGGIVIDHPTKDGICYIGPCEPGTGGRTVCYTSETGCDNCFFEYDPQCT
jgi:hypothetical protein